MIEEIIAFFLSPFLSPPPQHSTASSCLINGENKVSLIKRCGWDIENRRQWGIPG